MNIESFYVENNITSPESRRSLLIKNMKELISEGKGCASCLGHCCTYRNNSMQVTPLEVLDVYHYLERTHQVNEELVHKLKENIKAYRLDREIPTKGGGALRRYYTCPFYEPGARGCGLTLEDKPYGCLGFNPLEKNVSKEGSCQSNQELLQSRLDQNIQELEYNKIIKDKFQLFWDKRNLPWALLNLIELFQHK